MLLAVRAEYIRHITVKIKFTFSVQYSNIADPNELSDPSPRNRYNCIIKYITFSNTQNGSSLDTSPRKETAVVTSHHPNHSRLPRARQLSSSL